MAILAPAAGGDSGSPDYWGQAVTVSENGGHSPDDICADLHRGLPNWDPDADASCLIAFSQPIRDERLRGQLGQTVNRRELMAAASLWHSTSSQ